MRTRLAVLLLLLGPLVASGQEPPVYRAGVELVQIEVRVTDDEGQPITDLEPADFTLKDQGEVQEIELFQFLPGAGGEAARIVRGESGPPRPTPGQDESHAPYTWLYIAPEVRSPVEFARAAGPLRQFIRDLPEGFLVSLAGLPFTDDRRLLLASLERMVGEPLGGEAGRAGVVDPLLGLQDDLAFQREVFAALQRQNGILTSFVGMHRDSPAVPRADDVSQMVSVEKVDRQMVFYGELALLRYLDLVERMAAFPGKKVIVLYRSGLRLAPGHGDLLDQIAAAALRHRVSVFTLDSGGLEAEAPVEDRRARFAWEAGRRRPLQDSLGLPEARQQDVDGLVTLAQVTGGKAVVDSNDSRAVFESVLEESSNYYVLGYAPRNPRESGRFRDVEVSVRRAGVEVRAPRGYYERTPFDRQSGKERSIALYRTLLSDAPAEIPVKASVSFFAAPQGRTAMVFSVGIRPGDLAAKAGKKPELEATALVRIRSRVLESMPLILEQELRPEVARGFLARASADPSLYLTYNGRVDLPPGPYSVRVLVRDDRSGRMGTYEGVFQAPAFDRPSVPSSLLLTRQARPRGPSARQPGEPGDSVGEAAFEDLLAVGDLQLTPEPVRAARPGHVVYCTYHLYNATAEDFAVAERQGMQMGLLRGEDWVDPGAVRAGGQPFPDRERGVIRFVGWVETENLTPGRYTLLTVLPNYRKRKVPDLSEEFDLLPPD